jgi:DNA-binding NtrC family response regulator
MAVIGLHIHDSIQLITLKAMLESEGHTVHRHASEPGIQVVFAELGAAHELDSRGAPVVVIASVSEIPDAVKLMSDGFWGYITTPLQPREASLVTERVLRASSQSIDDSKSDTLETLESIEFDHIRKALRLCNGNQAKAARVLNIGRNTLWRKLKKMEQSNT